MWDLNDFDEVTWGPWEWDIKRLAASFNVAMRENPKSKISERFSVVKWLVAAYYTNFKRLAKMPALELWSDSIAHIAKTYRHAQVIDVLCNSHATLCCAHRGNART